LDNQNIIIRVATPEDVKYAETITGEMAESAKARGTGIAKRSPDYIAQKMNEGKAVIAVTTDGDWVGFCYIETWSHGEYVANSGLIVSPEYRKTGVAKAIKKKIFNLSREKYPDAKLFGLTTGLAVMKINSELGYEPVTYEILMSKDRKNCMCTAMLYDPKDHYKPEETTKFFEENKSGLERLLQFKRWKLLKPFLKKKEDNARPDNPVGPGNSEESKPKTFLQYFFNV
jgi:hypothetical protein